MSPSVAVDRPASGDGPQPGVELALASHMGGESSSFVPFLVLADSRTGSTWLCDLLRSHPDIVAFDEVFHRRSIFGARTYGTDSGGILSRDATEIARRERDPARYLRTVVYAPRNESVRAVGFKIFYRHFYRTDHRFRLAPALAAVPGLRIVSLTRRDLVGMLASRTMAWGPQAGRDRITLSAAACLAFFAAYGLQSRFWERYFSNCDVLRVTYEDLVGDERATTSAILKHLGCADASLTSGIARADHEPIETLVSNYAQLRRTFRGTSWGKLFP